MLRWRYLILGAVAAVASLHSLSVPFRDDWQFFVHGSQLMFGFGHGPDLAEPGGLHLYANYPEIQIGPLSLLLVTVLRVFGEDGSRAAGIVLMTAVGPLIIWVLERTSEAMRPVDEPDRSFRQRTVLLGGAVVMVAWGELAAYAVHLDDVLTLLFAAVAMGAVARCRPLALGLTIGLAAASKPWGIVLLPLVLALRGRNRVSAALTAFGVLSLTWLPFAISDSGTIGAANHVPVDPRSVLTLFGMHSGAAPDWVRPAQLFAAMALGALAARSDRWAAVPLIGVAVRIAIDPATFGYYATGLVLTAFAWELLRSRRPVPLLTLALFLMLLTPGIEGSSYRVQALIRLLSSGSTIVLALALPMDDVVAIPRQATPRGAPAPLR